MQKRMSYSLSSIRFRLAACSVIGLVIIGLVAIFARYSYMKNTEAFFSRATADRQQVFDEIVKAKSESLETFAYDYSYWDDMVRFVKTKDPSFAEINLEPSLDTYKASALWLYDANGTKIYELNNLDAEPGEAAISDLEPSDVKQLFTEGDDPIHHFFTRTKLGIMEVFGAPIQPSSDAERVTRPQGYLFTGRIIDDKFLGVVAKSTRAEVSLKTTEFTQPIPRFTAKDGKLLATKDLNDWKGGIVGRYIAVFPADNLKQLYSSQSQMAQMILVVYGFTTIFYAIILWMWVLDPLNNIYEALQNRRKEAIKDLVTKESEFGKIARMIAHFFDQQNDMIAEVEAMRVTQARLTQQSEELEHMNSLMVGREIKMAELKKRIVDLEEGKAHEAS